MPVADERRSSRSAGRARRPTECELPLMVHISFGPPEIEEVLPFLQPGDMLTHCFTGYAMKIVDDEGRLRESALGAPRAGVLMDVGHGTGSFTVPIARGSAGQGYART